MPRDVYNYLRNYAPGLRKILDMQNMAAPPFMPRATQIYSEAQSEMMSNLALFEPKAFKGENSQGTFLPPVHIIANAEVTPEPGPGARRGLPPLQPGPARAGLR